MTTAAAVRPAIRSGRSHSLGYPWAQSSTTARRESLMVSPCRPQRRQLEDVVLPRSDIQIESVSGQFVAVPLVDGVAHQVLEAPAPAGQAGERRPEPALAQVWRIVHRDQQPLLARAAPGAGH